MQEYIDLLKEFISFKSISTSSQYTDGINETVNWLEKTFEENGFKVEIVKGFANPILLAELIIDESAETALIYGHYDVQPAEKADGWRKDPFEIEETEERLIARGIVDNKGQVAIHMYNVFKLHKEGNLKYNVKFMIEGNEETGSPKLPEFLSQYKEKLAADFAIISDGELKGESPTIAVGFRGGMNCTLEVKTSNTDLHSGIFGGATPSALFELHKFLRKLFNEDSTVNIPDFYNDVDEVPTEIRKLNKSIQFSEEDFKKLSGTKKMLTRDNNDFYTQTGLQPAVEITGIQSGYTGEGYRNGIPSVATAKINFRFVNSQNPEKIAEDFKAFVSNNLPDYVDYSLDVNDPYNGIKLELTNKYIALSQPILEEIYEKPVVFEYSGGGLPIVTLFDKELSIPQLVVNLANEDCGMHVVGVNFNKKILKKGLDFSYKFFSKEQN